MNPAMALRSRSPLARVKRVLGDPRYIWDTDRRGLGGVLKITGVERKGVVPEIVGGTWGLFVEGAFIGRVYLQNFILSLVFFITTAHAYE